MNSKFSLCSILLIAIACCGCGSEYPSVSGTITINGDPVSPVEVVFAPKATEDSAVPGLASSAVTDENGNFSLKMSDGKNGAVVGSHSVGFRWADIHPDSMRSLKGQVRSASPEVAEEIQRAIDDLQQKLQGRPKLPESMETEFEVTASGSDEANFELTDFQVEQE